MWTEGSDSKMAQDGKRSNVRLPGRPSKRWRQNWEQAGKGYDLAISNSTRFDTKNTEEENYLT